MFNTILLAQYLQAQAWWRLDSAGASARHTACSVISLLDTAAYLRDVTEDDPDLVALEAAGCFRGGAFDPGPAGAVIVRAWELTDEPTAGPRDLLQALARAARRDGPPEVSIPRQASAIPAAR